MTTTIATSSKISSSISSTSKRNPVAIVTGGTSSIGLETCKQLSFQGIDVIFTSRTREKGDKTIDEIQQYVETKTIDNTTNTNQNNETDIIKPGKVEYLCVDMSKLLSVKKICDTIVGSSVSASKASASSDKNNDNDGDDKNNNTSNTKNGKVYKVDYLLLNAGVIHALQKERVNTEETDIEDTVAVNHVASYYIARRLIPYMEQIAREEGARERNHDTTTASTLDNTNNKNVNNNTTVRSMITFVSSDLHNIHSATGASKVIQPIVTDELVRYLSTMGSQGVDGTAAYNNSSSDDDDDDDDDSNFHLSFHYNWAYKYSKLLNVLTAEAIHQRLQTSKSPISCNSMEPGFIPQSELSRKVKQNLGKYGIRCFLFCVYHTPMNWLIRYMLQQPVRTLEEGAASEIYALTKGVSGKYYRLDEIDDPSPLVLEQDVVDNFYNNTETLLNEKGYKL